MDQPLFLSVDCVRQEPHMNADIIRQFVHALEGIEFFAGQTEACIFEDHIGENVGALILAVITKRGDLRIRLITYRNYRSHVDPALTSSELFYASAYRF